MPIEIAETVNGLISGIPGGKPGITIFKGIPYARPPVGDFRWRSPLPVIPWSGIRRADQFSCISFQPRTGSFFEKEFFPDSAPMSEDCLYLNVWTPAGSADEKLPVMFWIHGGCFLNGYGHEKEFDGEGFCDKGVVLVTINYRLGLFGFLAHPELSAESENGVSGNYGILDQIATLKWVKNNIPAFGGNADNITVFGQSAGALSVQALMSSPLAKGLINKAILQSGGGIRAISNTLLLKNAEKTGIELSSVFNFASVSALRQIPPEELVNRFPAGKTRRFSPNVDGYVLSEDISEAIIHGNHQDISVIMGSTADEIRMISQTDPIIFEATAKVRYGKYAGQFLELCNVKTDEQASSDNTFAEKVLAAVSAYAELQEEQEKKPAYIYYFTRKLPGDDMGAFHSGELWYLFQTLSRSWRPFEKLDYDLSEIMAAYWTNFAKTGNPNGSNLPLWTTYTRITIYYGIRYVSWHGSY